MVAAAKAAVAVVAAAAAAAAVAAAVGRKTFDFDCRAAIVVATNL